MAQKHGTQMTKALKQHAPGGTSTKSDIVRTVPASPLLSQYQRYLYRGLKDPQQLATINDRVLRTMANNDVVRACIRHICQQVKGYCQVPSYRGAPGFRITTRDPQDQMGKADRERAAEIEHILLQGGIMHPRRADGRMGVWSSDGKTTAKPMGTWASQTVEDILTLGRAGMRLEKGIDSKRYPVAWFRPVDAGIIRIASPEFYEREYRDKAVKFIEFVLLDGNNRVVYELAWDEFSYWENDPSNEFGGDGYGRSPLAYMVDMVAGVHYVWRYNLEQFSGNKLPHGILALPNLDDDSMDTLMADLEMAIGGSSGGWHGIPALRSKGDGQPPAAWIPLGNRPGDMEWREFLLTGVAKICAGFGLLPEQIGFPSVSQAASNNVLQQADPASRIAYGHESGFVPVMRGLQEVINRDIVSKFDDSRWRMVWEQLGQQTETANNALRRDRLSMGYSSVAEERAEGDRPTVILPVNLELWQKIESSVLAEQGDLLREPDRLRATVQELYARAGGVPSLATAVPLSPSIMQVWTMELQAQQQTAMMAQQQQQGPEQQPGQEAPQEVQQPPTEQNWEEKPPEEKAPLQEGAGEDQPEQPEEAAPKPRGFGKSLRRIGRKLYEVVIRRHAD